MVENVASMPKEARDDITRNLFGIEPVLINSASRAYKGIGNSWTVDVIAHIFRFMI